MKRSETRQQPPDPTNARNASREPEEDRYEIRLAGAGGQGIILAAVVLARALTSADDNHVCQTQSYGPEARGGKCKAEIVVSSRPIDYPKVIKQDLLLAMNQASCDAYFFDFKPNGLLIVDATFVHQLPTSRAIALPFTEMARQELGREIVANMVALGAVAHFCPRVTAAQVEEAVAASAPAGTVTLNRKAFRLGLKAARSVNVDRLPRSILPNAGDEEDEA